LVKQARTPSKRTEPGTRVMDPGMRPAPSSGGRGLLYGIGAFLAIAVIGGVGGYFMLFQSEEAPVGKRVPVVVERATSVVDTARPPEPAPEPAKAPDPAPPPAGDPVKAVKPPRRVAVADPVKPPEPKAPEPAP